MKKIAIIIPAYNEHENILILLNKLNKLKYIKTIIIIDDSSNDLTKHKIKKSKIKVKYYKRVKKLGRGSAVLFGIKKIIKKLSENDLIVEMDADLSHNPNELSRNIKFFVKNKSDLLISSRYLKGSKIINWGLNRKILSRTSNILAKFFLNVPVNDYTNGFRIYNKKSAKLILKKCGRIGEGFIILSEILICIHNSGLKINEIKTIFINRVRGESSVNFKLILNSFVGLIKLYLIKKNYL